MSNEYEMFEYGKEVVEEMVKYHLGEFIFAGVFGGGSYFLGKLGARHALRSGHLGGPSAVIQTTAYDPAFVKDASGKPELLINPVTGNNYRDQKIRTEEVPISLATFFDKKVAGELVGYFNKAAELASEDSPIVYLHLEKVLPKKGGAQIHELIKNSVQNYISGLYRDTDQILAENLQQNQYAETNRILPALIREEGAVGFQLRILLLKLNEDGNIDLPRRQDVRYLMTDGSYQTGDKSVETDRYSTLRIIQAMLEEPALKEKLSQYVVEIPTGNIVTIPQSAQRLDLL